MTQLPRPQSYIEPLQPYHPGTPIEVVARKYGMEPGDIVKLASNENPAGMSPKAKAAIAATLAEANRYPDPYVLLETLAAKHSVSMDQVVLGNGSVDLLNMIAMAYLGQDSSAVSSAYGFAIYALVTQAAGSENIITPAIEYGHDLSAMQSAVRDDTRVIWIANPNNPTGTFVPYDVVADLLRSVSADVLVVLDEAYFDYLDPADQADAVAWLAKHPNLVLLRTFSKIYGMAGMRIGYAVASAVVADTLNRVRMPFNASVPALAGAVAALRDDRFISESTALNAEQKTVLSAEMAKRGIRSLPAYGNFLTLEVGDATEVYARMERLGVIVRPLGGYGMPGWIRVTVGTAAENKAFMAALDTVLS